MTYNCVPYIFSTDTYHLNANEIRLDTHVRGLPTPLVEWWKDGQVLEKTNAKYSQCTDADGNSELIVYFPHPSDSGRYTCHASNRAGESSIGQFVVYEGTAEDAETKLVRVFHHDAHRVEQAKIAARGGIPVKRDAWIPPPTPPPEDEPKRKSRFQPLPPKNEPEAEAISYLPVEYPPIVIETTFAESSDESEEEEPLYVRRNRHPPRPREMLRFTAPLTKQTVASGGRAKFTCYLEGPDQHSRWVKLFVEKPQPKDEDEYVSRYCPPEIDDSPKEPVFVDLENGDKYSITMRDGLLTLCVNDVDDDDAGEYTVICHNKVCEIRCTGTLVVYKRMDALKTPAFFVCAMKGWFCVLCVALVLLDIVRCTMFMSLSLPLARFVVFFVFL